MIASVEVRNAPPENEKASLAGADIKANPNAEDVITMPKELKGTETLELTKTGYLLPRNGPARLALLERWTSELARIKRLAEQTLEPRHSGASRRLEEAITHVLATGIVGE
jgi:hypothetical protein